MAATTTPEPPETELTPELIERVKKLSPESQEQLVDLIYGPMPPGPDDAEIARRLDELAAGNVTLLTREEAEAQVREAIRKLGVEL